MLSIANSEKYRDLAPSKIVPLLADEGTYIASESSFYRILSECGQLTHRQRSKQPRRHQPKACIANSPNQVWSWDISYSADTSERNLFFSVYDYGYFQQKNCWLECARL